MSFKRLLLFLCVYMLGVLTMYFWIQLDSTYQLLKNHPVRTNLAFKKEIAKDLIRIHQQLSNDCGVSQGKTVASVDSLQFIIERLDSEVFYSSVNFSHSKNIPMCPEKYHGPRKDFKFFQKNFQIEPCSYGMSVGSQVSVIIDLVHASPGSQNSMETVLEGLWTAYPDIHVVLTYAEKSDITKLSRYKDKHLTMIYVSGSLGSTLNSALEKVTTNHVLISRNLVYFSKLTRFDRLLRVALELPQAAVVSGSYRNMSGHWTSGCLQSTMMNYAMKIEEGYRHSSQDCMFCDIIQAPALFHLPTAKKYSFNEQISLVFEDFFLRLKHAGYLILSCPDVMFFADLPHLPDYMPKHEWLNFAVKWKLDEIVLIESKHVFTCAEVGVSCNTDVTKALMLPRCCIQQFYGALYNFSEFLSSNNISYELDSGSQLGAVKFTGFIPWDIDGDINVDKGGWPILLEARHTPRFRDIFPLNIIKKMYRYQDGLFHFNTPDVSVEVYTTKNLNIKLLPPQFHSVPTLTRLGPYWFQSKVNPALYARARYGPGYLKHSQSWKILRHKHSYIPYKSGTFNSCPTPFFHSCLDRFPTDGNLDFILS